MQVRTDLALEAKEIAGEKISGVTYDTDDYENMKVTRMQVQSREAAEKLGKDKGTYITIELPPLTDDFKETDERLRLSRMKSVRFCLKRA